MDSETFYPLVDDDSLFEVVQKAVSRELLQANHYATRATLYLRVLKRIADSMGISWAMIQDLKNLLPIHRDCLRAVESIWQSQQLRLSAPVYSESSSSAPSSVTLDELNTFEKFMSRDYARPADLMKLISILYKREVQVDQRHPRDLAHFMTSAGWHALYYVLAVDGFSGPELKNYWEALRYPIEEEGGENDFRSVHIGAVRKMYQLESRAKPEEVRRAITDAFDSQESENSLKRLYVECVGMHLETIREWKKYEEQQQRTTTKKGTPLITKGGGGGGEKVESERKRGRQPNSEKRSKKMKKAAPVSSLVVIAEEEEEEEEERLSPDSGRVEEKVPETIESVVEKKGIKGESPAAKIVKYSSSEEENSSSDEKQ